MSLDQDTNLLLHLLLVYLLMSWMLFINYYTVPLARMCILYYFVVDTCVNCLYRAELMVKEIFDKLRRCDKMIKMKRTGESEPSPNQLPDQTMRWLQTILQLMNYRFIRFLKSSPLSSGLLHYIRYSISFLDNRQCYRSLESFTINTIVSTTCTLGL